VSAVARDEQTARELKDDGARRHERRRLVGVVITGVHAIIFTKDPEVVRAFFHDVLGFPSVDAGGGWLIFALPPAELAAHPTNDGAHHKLYLMCDDIHATVTDLEGKGVEFATEISEAGFGLITSLRLPDGEELALSEPRRASPLSPSN
jgi:predicted enzyme related to lactoylglutathione lyase